MARSINGKSFNLHLMLKKTDLDDKVDKNVELDPKVAAEDFPYLWEII